MRILNNYIVEGRKEGKGREGNESNRIKSNQIKPNRIESNQSIDKSIEQYLL
jgi:hypothetical protein